MAGYRRRAEPQPRERRSKEYAEARKVEGQCSEKNVVVGMQEMVAGYWRGAEPRSHERQLNECVEARRHDGGRGLEEIAGARWVEASPFKFVSARFNKHKYSYLLAPASLLLNRGGKVFRKRQPIAGSKPFCWFTGGCDKCVTKFVELNVPTTRAATSASRTSCSRCWQSHGPKFGDHRGEESGERGWGFFREPLLHFIVHEKNLPCTPKLRCRVLR